jgi:hypothetical protein
MCQLVVIPGETVRGTISLIFNLLTVVAILLGSASPAPGAEPAERYLIVRNGLYGYIDGTGREVIPPRFVWADGFSENRATVFVCGGLAAIDETGEVVIPPGRFTRVPFRFGLAPLYVGDKVGFQDGFGKTVIPPRFEDAGPFSEGLAAAKLEGKFGYINITGDFVIAPRFDNAGQFVDGLAIVETVSGFAWIDGNGKRIAEMTTAGVFGEGLLVEEKDDRYGYRDRDGVFVIPHRFENAGTFSEGLAPVEIKNRWGFINRAGEFVIAPQFDRADEFKNGLAVVQLGHLQGAIDRNGDLVVPAEYKGMLGFYGNLSVATTLDDISVYVNKNGRVVWSGDQGAPTHPPLSGWSHEDAVESCRGYEKKYQLIDWPDENELYTKPAPN